MTVQRLAKRTAGAGLLALLVGCASFGPPPVARPDPALLSAMQRLNPHACNPSVASVLTGAGLAGSQVRGLVYGPYRDPFSDRIVRYDAWVGLTDQPGTIVVTVDEDCRPIQIYARGGAHLPGAAP